MEIDDKLVQKLKAEHYEAVSIRSELKADVRGLEAKTEQLKEEISKLENELSSYRNDTRYSDIIEDMKDIYELLTGKRYAELFKKLSDVIYQTIGRVV